jgi:PiT family inorganic phosphate transporter
MPSSSSHALVGSLLGATLVSTGRVDSVNWGWHDFDVFHPHGVAGVVAALLFSPVLGFVCGYYLHRLTMRLLRGARPSVDRHLRRLQVVAAAGLAFSHGANDAQKAMGVITLLLVSHGTLTTFAVPLWVKLAAATAISLGVVTGGRRIMRTIGSGIFRIRPVHGLSSQTASAGVILGNALVGGPVSTTHVVSSAIMGVGAGFRRRAVRWGTVREILLTWALTIPLTMVFSAIVFAGLRAVID